MSRLIVPALIVLLCTALYAWTADFPMLFDDHLYIEGNPFLKEAGTFARLAHLADFVALPARLGVDPDLATNFILRPVAYATFRLNYIFDGLNPRWYRVANIIIHALNSALVWLLLRKLLARGAHARQLPAGTIVFVPAAASLLFAAHPLATESVTYIIQRFTSLSTLFFLLALGLYFASLESCDRRARWMRRLGAMAAVAAGMMTKECVFTAPLVAVVLDALTGGVRPRAAIGRAWPLLIFLPVVPLMVVLAAMAQHPADSVLASAVNIVNAGDDAVPHWYYLVTQITVVAAYLHRVLWPAGLNADPAWSLHHSLAEPPVLLALAELTGVLVTSWWAWRRWRDDLRAASAFAFTLWFFITVSVSSGLVPLPDLMADHRSYLPSIGIFVVMACALDAVRTHGPRAARRLAPAAAFLCVTAHACITCARNSVWRSGESLWSDSVRKSPHNHRAWGSLGAHLADAGRDQEAVGCYREALRIKPDDHTSMFNLSNSLLRLNQPREALDTMHRLIDGDRAAADSPPVTYTLGIAYAGVGDVGRALPVLKQAVETAPDNPMPHIMLGRIYLSTNQPGRALEHFRIASTLCTPDENLLASIKAAEAAAALTPSHQ
ncbi:MAG: tetratricopeptide repeat protein [Verrucomicrobiaceae bacterium]|nr:tetratricopeptide repeat protein [Verrucomicrobiaceae bacterium]